MAVTRVIDVEHRRRLLVERHFLGATGRVDRTVGDVVGALSLLHSTDPSTPYLMLHARTDASVADVDAVLYETRELVRHTCVRRTVFVMPFDTARAAHGAANDAIVAKLRAQLVGWIDASEDPLSEGRDAAEFLARVEGLVLERLTDGGPATGTVLADDIEELRLRFDPMPGAAYSKPQRITSKVLEILAASGGIARAQPTGADFTSGSWTWASTTDWFAGRLDLTAVDGGGGRDVGHDEAAALASLLDRYLAAFGPATVTDMTWWTGLTKTKVRAALGTIDAEEVVLDGGDEPGFVRGGDALEVAGAAVGSDAGDRPAGPIVAL
ncbi:MAG: crosslink repair DNA glycosylase YcaQ family protein, partial [Actinomycetota bacterium]